MQRIAIIGSRSIIPSEHIEVVSAWLRENLDLSSITSIVSGGAEGADTLAENLAEILGKEMIVFAPQYKQYGNKATFVRNEQIAESAEGCLAVVDKPLKMSKGTFNCTKKFKKLGKPIWVLELTPEILEGTSGTT